MKTARIEIINIVVKELKTNVEQAESIARVLSKKTKELLINKYMKGVE